MVFIISSMQSMMPSTVAVDSIIKILLTKNVNLAIVVVDDGEEMSEETPLSEDLQELASINTMSFGVCFTSTDMLEGVIESIKAHIKG